MESELHFKKASTTFIENWPQALKKLSIAHVDVPLTRDETIALGKGIIELGELFEHYPSGSGNAERRSILHKLQDAVGHFPRGVFVRLGSRSPKDALYPTANPARNGMDAWVNLTACSERVSDDLLSALHFEYLPHIFVREWVKIEPWQEFRCFMRARDLVGISQYFYREEYPEIERDALGIAWAIREQFFPHFRAASHLDDVVFDVFVTKRTGKAPLGGGRNAPLVGQHEWRVKLIEINPYYNWTDPCLFDWDKPEMFDGSLRTRRHIVRNTARAACEMVAR